MKISTKARYAVMAMLELALHENKGSVNLTEISRAQKISLSYLEQLFAHLRSHGLVKGRRGPGGGYKLARPAEEISVAEIIRAVSGDEGDQAEKGADRTAEDYRPAALWNRLSQQMFEFLKGINLAQCLETEISGNGSGEKEGLRRPGLETAGLEQETTASHH